MDTTFLAPHTNLAIMKCYEEVPIEPAHNKTNNKTCVTSKDSDQTVHLPSMAMVLVYPSLGGCGRHMRSKKTDQTGCAG